MSDGYINTLRTALRDNVGSGGPVSRIGANGLAMSSVFVWFHEPLSQVIAYVVCGEAAFECRAHLSATTAIT